MKYTLTLIVIYTMLKISIRKVKKTMRFKRFLIKMGAKGKRHLIADQKVMNYCHDNGIGV